MMTSVQFFIGLFLYLAREGAAVSIPPRITRQSPETIYYKVNETVKITCDGTGEPHPGFSWKRQNIDFNPAGNDDRITQMKGKGTLIINSPEAKDEGIYQCFAQNPFGTAVSIKFNLRMAKLDEFKSEDPIYHKAQLGEPLAMSCQSPDSVPDPIIYWVVEQKDRSFQIINWNSSVSMDYEDRIHFSHVSKLTHQDGQPYRCVVYNSMMRLNQVGPPHYVSPLGTSDQLRDIKIAWPKSRFNQFGLAGTTKNLKCIFSGNPTPIVRWRRANNAPFDQKRVITAHSDGQELTIRDLRLSDAGSYVCEATSQRSGPQVVMSFNLTVASKPVWIHKPKDVVTGEGATAEFVCDASGVPKPSVLWFVNGHSLEFALKNDTRLNRRFKRLESNKIRLMEVTKDDAMVFQCNVTNLHGYVWGEAYLNVLNEAPRILKKPKELIKVAEGRSFEIICNIYGKPDPIITWFKDGNQITGGRFHIKDTGNLYVEHAVLSDGGQFVCQAYNKFGNASAIGSVLVRRKTLIELPPRDLEVTRDSYAKFTCSGVTDPEEVENLRVVWLKDYKEIELGERFFKNYQDNSLILSGAQVRDSGTFTCELHNGLDMDRASARLEVTDVPNISYDVKINNTCQADGKAKIIWTPGSFNNAPIQYFTIEYNTSIDPDNWSFATRVLQTKAVAFIPLNHGLTYSFRVVSVNKIGSSPPSLPSIGQCVTLDGRPQQNPRNVRTIGNIPRKIHIEWTPVPPKYQGGKNFYYSLVIGRVGFPDVIFYKKDFSNDWRMSSFQKTDSGIDYEAFEITLMSKNSNGDCLETPKTIIGYSAEATPIISPSELEAVNVGFDSVVLQWRFPHQEINKIGTRIKGEFNGFQVQIWVEGRAVETIRQWMLPAVDFDGQTTDLFNTTIRHMMPNSPLEANVAVLNNFFIGAPSPIIKFRTKPGLPGPVSYLDVEVIGDNHITLRWGHPLDDRGDVVGYDIGYQRVRGGLELEEMQDRQPQIIDPYATNAILPGLLPLTKYRIHIWARTDAGRGESYFIERTTGPPGELVPPRFNVPNVGRTHINISWWVDQYKDSNSVIFAEYKQKDGAEWFTTTQNVSGSWVDIKRLQPGTDYLVRVVVTNSKTRLVSMEQDVQTDGDAVAYDVVANLGWFLGMIFSLILHIALIILFICCYNKGFRFQGRREEVRNYRNGADTYIGIPHNTDKLGRKSEDFGPEPRGHTNDYYEDHDSYEDFDKREEAFRVDKPPPKAGTYDKEYEPYNYSNDYDQDDDDYPSKPGAYSSHGSNEYPSRDRYDDDYNDRYDNRRGYYDNDANGRGYDDGYDYDDDYNNDHRQHPGYDYDYDYDQEDHDQHYHHNDPDHDHERCRDVVDEVSTRLSGNDPRRDHEGHASSFV